MRWWSEKEVGVTVVIETELSILPFACEINRSNILPDWSVDASMCWVREYLASISRSLWFTEFKIFFGQLKLPVIMKSIRYEGIVNQYFELD